jgi:hypothetical protein
MSIVEIVVSAIITFAGCLLVIYCANEIFFRLILH